MEDDPNHATDHTDAAEECRHGASLIPQLVILDAREGRCYYESRHRVEYNYISGNLNMNRTEEEEREICGAKELGQTGAIRVERYELVQTEKLLEEFV